MLLVWLGEVMWVWVGLTTRTRARRQWRVAEEGEGERGRATAGSLVLFIGWRAPGRSEWCLGEVGLAWDDSTARWRREQMRGAWRGGAADRGGIGDAFLRKEGPRGRPGGLGGLPRVHLAADALWTRSTGGVRASGGEMERGDEGRGLFAISKSSGTSR